jgi:hypothetical protein
VWDDVYFIDGYPGDYSVLARRSGTSYYVSGINGKKETKTVTFNPDFLETGEYKATYYMDGEKHQTFRFETTDLNPEDPISIEMIPLGGFVMVIERI